MFDSFTSGMSSGDWMAAGLSIAFSVLALWYVFAGGKMRITLWHVAFMGFAGFLLGTALQSYLQLWDWIELGLTFSNLGASMFLIGFISMMAVMIYNLVDTDGRTLVR